MVRAFAAGRAGANVLARQHGVTLRVLDLGVDEDDLDDLPAEITAYHVRPASPIHEEDALSDAEARRALLAGQAIAEAELAHDPDLLILGDMGIGNTTPATALIAATFGLAADQVVGRGTGVDDVRLARKTAVITAALTRMGDRVTDPMTRLAGLGSADLAAGVGFLLATARAGVPVLLDGVVSAAEVAIAEELEPGLIAWCAAGHRSTEPAQQVALEKLGLEPLLDLGLRLGEGTGALAALPVLRSAVLLIREVALLSDVASEA
jgi:nicotinate-nucleotide--dimethylbenzimidazole phosphoribosyltransferase